MHEVTAIYQKQKFVVNRRIHYEKQNLKISS